MGLLSGLMNLLFHKPTSEEWLAEVDKHIRLLSGSIAEFLRDPDKDEGVFMEVSVSEDELAQLDEELVYASQCVHAMQTGTDLQNNMAQLASHLQKVINHPFKDIASLLTKSPAVCQWEPCIRNLQKLLLNKPDFSQPLKGQPVHQSV